MLEMYLPAIASIAGSLLNRRFARSDMEYQNEYNSPKNQVARLKAAGLSPWSMNPQSNLSAQPLYGNVDLSSGANAAASNKLADRQLSIQEKLTDAEIQEKESQSRVNESVANTNAILLQYLGESERQRIRVLAAQAAETEKRVFRYDEEVNQNIATQKSAEMLNYAKSAQVVADTERINKLVEYEVKEASSRIKVNENQVAYLKTMCKLNNHQCAQLVELISKTKVEADKIGAEAWFEKYKNRIVRATGVRPGSAPWVVLSDFAAKILSDTKDDRVQMSGQMNGAGSW